MKLKMKKLVSLGLVSAMSLTMLAGCGNSNGATNDTGSSKNQESKAAGDVKIGVLVQDVSGEEALGFRAYYEDYVADQYGVTFTYTDELKDAASEKSAIEKLHHRDIRLLSHFQVMIVHFRLKPVKKIRYIMRLQLEILMMISLNSTNQMSVFLDRSDQACRQSMKPV